MPLLRQSRRGFLGGLLAGVVVPARAVAAGDAPSDRGIGGTGLAAAPPSDGDRGIGGTGVIGTIRRFGSIVVNGLRVAYPEDVRVTIDGQAATLADLRLGHVVAVAASNTRGKLSTSDIAVSREVVGPVGSIDGKTLSVLGQSIRVDGVMPKIAAGDWVAVSGLRRVDGSIAASLVEPALPGVARIAGPLVAQGSGVAVGGLSLSGAGGNLAGQRVLVEGTLKGSEFALSSISADRTVASLGAIRNVSIESFVAREDGRLRLGSGLSVQGVKGRSADGRAVVTASVAPNGELRADRIAPAPGGGLGAGGPQRAPAGDRIGPRPGGAGGGPGGGAGSGGPGHGGARPGGGTSGGGSRNTPLPTPGNGPAGARGSGSAGGAGPSPGGPGGFGNPHGFGSPSSPGGPGGFGRGPMGGPGGFGGGGGAGGGPGRR